MPDKPQDSATPPIVAHGDKHFMPAGSGALHPIFPGVNIRTHALENVMISVVHLEAGAVVALHQHPHEQMGLLISGVFDFTIGDETRRLHPGDMWRIPSNVPHTVVAVGGPAVALDVFSPIREDYL